MTSREEFESWWKESTFIKEKKMNDRMLARASAMEAWQASQESQSATIAQLQLDNARMREALGAIRVWCESPDTDLEDSIGRLACEALATQPTLAEDK